MSQKTKLLLELQQSIILEKIKDILKIANDPTETIHQRVGRIEAICEACINIMEHENTEIVIPYKKLQNEK